MDLLFEGALVGATLINLMYSVLASFKIRRLERRSRIDSELFQREVLCATDQLEKMTRLRQALEADQKKLLEHAQTVASDLQFFSSCGEGVLKKLDRALLTSRSVVDSKREVA